MTVGDTVDAARIFLPMAALAEWTFAVMLLIPCARFRAAFRGRVTVLLAVWIRLVLALVDRA